jgi:hypothetical protein
VTDRDGLDLLRPPGRSFFSQLGGSHLSSRSLN